MPGMSTLRAASLMALALGCGISLASVDQDSVAAALSAESCAADDEACAVSLRQLRGEQTSVLAVHGAEARPRPKSEDDDEADDEDDGSDSDFTKASSTKAPARTEDASHKRRASTTPMKKKSTYEDEEDDEEEEEATTTPKKKSRAGAEDGTSTTPKKKHSKADADDEEEHGTTTMPKKKKSTAADDEDDDDYDNDDDEDPDKEEEDEVVYGEFCCQFGQGMGATDATDVGATCYPSAKPEMHDYCDSKSTCAADCNGTWVTGFCAFNASGGSPTPCALELNDKGTGYKYVGSPSRAAGNDTCAAPAKGCGACKGTWCPYVRSPIY